MTIDTSDDYVDMQIPPLKKGKSSDLYLATDNAWNHRRTKLMLERGFKSTLIDEITLMATDKDWNQFIRTEMRGFHVMQTHNHLMIVTDLETTSWMECNLNSNTVVASIYGTIEEIQKFKDLCSSRFSITQSYVEWMYSPDGQSIHVPLRSDRTPFDEMYPFIGEPIKDYYDRFMQSDSSILVLMGPPGTGKTTFIRGLLLHSKSSATVTYDPQILEKDYIFARFIESSSSVMIMEDADSFLCSRSSGNTVMHKFLNVGDGLITMRNKKIIFSTNLPNVRDIDSALIRPGRCFDVVKFRDLTSPEAKVLADKVGVNLVGNKDSYTAAEIFNEKVNRTNQTFGIVPNESRN